MSLPVCDFVVKLLPEVKFLSYRIVHITCEFANKLANKSRKIPN